MDSQGSSITTNNLNPDFPLAGQNNSSQGFRDNFAAIKQQLETAKLEITELSRYTAKAMLKSAVGEQSLNNDLEFNQIIRAHMRSPVETYHDHGTLSGSMVVDYYQGTVQFVRLSGTTQVTFSNFPRGAFSARLTLLVQTLEGTIELAFGSGAIEHSYQKNIIVNSRLPFPSPGFYLLDFISFANGTKMFVNTTGGF